MDFSFWLGDQEFKLSLEGKGKNSIEVNVGGRTYNIIAEKLNRNKLLLNIDGRIYNIIVNSNSPSSCSVWINGRFYELKKKSGGEVQASQIKRAKKQDIRTSMPGRIVRVLVKEGEKVKENQPVMVLEAMKMQNEIKSPQAGIITKIGAKLGDSVETGALLFSVE